MSHDSKSIALLSYLLRENTYVAPEFHMALLNLGDGVAVFLLSDLEFADPPIQWQPPFCFFL